MWRKPVPSASGSCVFELGEGAHQRGLTQQAAAPAQAPQHHVEIGAATAPAGDLGEWVGGEQLLGEEWLRV